MIPEGVSSKAAVTRFNNNLAQGKRMTMPHNTAAQAAIRNTYSSKQSPAGPPVGPQSVSPDSVLSGSEPPAAGPAAVPQGDPQMPAEQGEGFSPEVFKQNLIDELVGRIRMEKFLNSPRVKDAVSSIQFKEFMNAKNPESMPDTRDLMTKVLSRMKMRPRDGA